MGAVSFAAVVTEVARALAGDRVAAPREVQVGVVGGHAAVDDADFDSQTLLQAALAVEVTDAVDIREIERREHHVGDLGELDVLAQAGPKSRWRVEIKSF